MSFSIMCPHCHKTFTQEDFEKNEQSLAHLKEFFNAKEQEYRNSLQATLKKEFEKQKATDIELAIQKTKQTTEKLWNEKFELLAQSKQQEKEQNQKEHQTTIDTLRQQINDLSKKYETEKQTKDAEIKAIVSAKEIEIIKNKQKEIDEIKGISQKDKDELQKQLNKLASDLKVAQQTKATEIANLTKELEVIKFKEITSLKDKNQAEKEIIQKEYEQLIAQLKEAKNKIVNEFETEKQLKQKDIDLSIEKTKTELNEQKQKEINALKVKTEQDLKTAYDEVNELKLKLEQGRNIRTGILGSNLENDFEAKMPTFFPEDSFEKTTKAINGRKPDFKLGILKSENETEIIGNILFELKNADKFDPKWEEKLVLELKEWNARFGIIIWTNSKAPFIRSLNNRDIFIINTDLEVISLIVNVLKFLIKKQYSLSLESQEEAKEQEFKARFDKWLQDEFNVLIGKAMKQFNNFDKSIEEIQKSSNKLVKIKDELSEILIGKIETALRKL